MTREKYYEITLHLNNIHDLFTAPAVDPFSEKASFVSGIEYIESELKPKSWRSEARTRTTIFLPKESIEPHLAHKTKDALQRYCSFKIRQNEHAKTALRWGALTALLVGIVFLLGAFFLSQFLSSITFLPSYLSTLLSSGFDIAVWVILWRPVDFFLFDLWPYWREDRTYKNMMKMEIAVSEEQ